MVRAENLIVKAKCFIPIPPNPKNILSLKSTTTSLMVDKGFEPENPTQTLNETGEWEDAAILRTRNCWSTTIVDLADYLPSPEGTVKIRLYMTGVHKIDFVGLDTTVGQEYTIMEATLFYAEHSESGKVTLKLLKSDDKYAELLPGEQIRLYFILPNKPADKNRSFIIQIEGHYYAIQ